MRKTLIEVSVEIDSRKESVLISEETYEILRDGAFLRNKRMEWFLFKTVRKYGTLTEENILKLMDEEWVL
jgi:hypothetical protein